jgi:hypothetical protein
MTVTVRLVACSGRGGGCSHYRNWLHMRIFVSLDFWFLCFSHHRALAQHHVWHRTGFSYILLTRVCSTLGNYLGTLLCSFPVAARTHCHKLGGVTPQEFILFQFCRQKCGLRCGRALLLEVTQGGSSQASSGF